MIELYMIEVFPDLTTVLKIYMTLPVTSCEAERNFSELSITKKKNYSRGKTELETVLPIIVETGMCQVVN
jgi:hypothetical protein